MASKRVLQVSVVGDATSLKRATASANTSIDGVGVHARESSTHLKKLGEAVAGAFAVEKIVEFAKKSVDAAEEEQKAQAKLTTQLKDSGISWDKHKESIERSVSAESKLAGFTKADLTDALANIVQVTGNVSKSEKDMALAADIARAKHMDLNTASLLVAKVAGGNTGILSRYGIVLKHGATATEALGVLQQKFAGQAKAYGDTAAGAQDKFKVAIDNVEVTLGKLLIPAITAVANAITGLINDFSSGGKSTSKFGQAVSTVFQAIKATVGAVIGAIRDYFTKHRADLKRLGQDVGALGQAIAAVWRGFVLPLIKRVLPAISQIVTGVFNVIDGAVKVLSGVLTGHFGKAWQGVKQIFKGGVQAVFGILRGATAPIRQIASMLWGVLTSAASNAFKAAVNLVIGFVNKIIGVIDLIPGVNIGKIKPLGGSKSPAGKDVGLGTTGGHGKLARGGAYGRTAGYVNSPIVMMGEEAPRHPEYVIPTNPAYRPRAKMLLAKAAHAIGFANGGVLSFSQIQDVWKGAGGKPGAANTMAWIAEAESGGNPLINNGGHVGRLPGGGSSIAAGLWQILGLPFPGDPYNAITNARMAIAKSGNGANLHPWDSSRSVWGPHIGKSGGGGLGFISHLLFPGKVLGQRIKDLIGKLPGISSLPSWLGGLGREALSAVESFIRSSLSGGGGGGGGVRGPNGVGTFNGVRMADWVIGSLNYAQRKLGVALHPTSGYRPGFDPHTANGRSEHAGTQYPHGAVDFGGYHDAHAKAIKMAVVNATRSFKYPLLAPMGFVDDGHASGTGHAQGGLVKTRVGELGAEDVYLPVGSRIVPNYASKRGGMGDVYLTQSGDVHIGSQKAARVMANRLAFRVAFG